MAEWRTETFTVPNLPRALLAGHEITIGGRTWTVSLPATASAGPSRVTVFTDMGGRPIDDPWKGQRKNPTR